VAASEHFDLGENSRSRREALIAGHEDGFEDLSQRHICGVESSEILTQGPDSWQEKSVWVPLEIKLREILKHQPATLYRNGTREHVSSYRLGHLDIDEMGCMQRDPRRSKALSKLLAD